MPPEVGIVVPDAGSSAVVTVMGWWGSFILAMVEGSPCRCVLMVIREKGGLFTCCKGLRSSG